MIPDILFKITGNQIFGASSILALAGFTYLAKRYLSNTRDTTNQWYLNSTELTTLTHPSQNQVDNTRTKYIFWNGSLGSTYLLIDLLLQDYIIQPIYIERYTILKELDKTYLADIISNHGKPETHNKISPEDRQYLQSVLKIKTQQQRELSQMTIIRNLIFKYYPEFKQNLLPTMYITTIQKDLEMTSNFFVIVKQQNPLGFDGVEILEQILRFWKYHIAKYPILSDRQLIIGITQDNPLLGIFTRILHEMMTNRKISSTLKGINLELPLENVSNSDLKYKAINIMNSEIMKYIIS